MKQRIVCAFLLSIIVVSFVHGQTASELFIKSPEPALLTLSVSDRMDLIDLYKAGEAATVKNFFSDSCSILRLTDDYLKFQSGTIIIEIFILTLINDSKIIGMIKTVCAPVCDSYIEFYTTSWRQLPASFFIKFADKLDFVKKDINRDDEKVKNSLIPLDIFFMQLNYDPEKQELQQVYTTPSYLSRTERESVKPYLIETPKRFKWNLMRFE